MALPSQEFRAPPHRDPRRLHVSQRRVVVTHVQLYGGISPFSGRRRGDSNSRGVLSPTFLAGRRTRPLCDISMCRIGPTSLPQSTVRGQTLIAPIGSASADTWPRRDRSNSAPRSVVLRVEIGTSSPRDRSNSAPRSVRFRLEIGRSPVWGGFRGWGLCESGWTAVGRLRATSTYAGGGWCCTLAHTPRQQKPRNHAEQHCQ